MYDVKCDELARVFLTDDDTPIELHSGVHIAALAQQIQDVIEDYIKYEMKESKP